MSPGDVAAAALRNVDPEHAHGLALAALKLGFGPCAPSPDPILATQIAGLSLLSPIGLAAGFDKNAEAPAALLRMGFGFVEVGTVTPLPQPGNPRPRLFRLPEDRAVINRLGFNNHGHEAVAARLSSPAPKSAGGEAKADMSATPNDRSAQRSGGGGADRSGGIVGVNVGANKESADRIADYVAGVRRFAALADYLTINVSSPNTPSLRDLQGRDALTDLLGRCTEALSSPAPRSAGGGAGRKPVLFLKVAPDLSDAQTAEIAETAARFVGGLIVSNTTLDRPATLRSALAEEAGGLSGAPLFARSTAVLVAFRAALPPHVALIGVGGVATAHDVMAKLRAGAAAVQLYTALVYEGPGLVARLHRDLAALLRAEGYRTVAEVAAA